MSSSARCVPFFTRLSRTSGALGDFVECLHGRVDVVRRHAHQHRRQVRALLLLAFAGLLGAGFIAQLGNTMGDNLTALFVLGAVWLVLRDWHAFARGEGLGQLLLAGLVMGLGMGLKLTNGIYAPALCVALLLVPAAGALRIRAAFLFGVGVLAGIAVTAGHWFWKMWTRLTWPGLTRHGVARRGRGPCRACAW